MKQLRERPKVPLFEQAVRLKCSECGYWIPEDLCRECRIAAAGGAVLQMVPASG